MAEDVVATIGEREQPADPAAEDRSTDSGPGGDSSRWQRWRERRRTRISKWDRPPPPKDWRYFVGMLGKVLIATGLLMFGFVAYQLWGTGIETARAQNKLEDTFEAQFEAAVASDPDTEAPDPTDDDPAGPTDEAPDDTAPDDVDGPDDTAPTEEPSSPAGPPSSIVPGGVDLSDGAVEQDVPVAAGEAFAKLDIERVGIDDLYVVPGVQMSDLKKGPGHYPDTPLPGQLGNASIAGHRTTYGAPFFDLDKLEPGDEIVVTMVTGDQYVYSVTGSEVVTASDYWVITTRDPNVAELTLTTCDPKYTARNRLIVHSVLVPERSSQVGVAEFYDFDELQEDREAATQDAPTVVAGDTTVAAADTPDTTPDATAGTTPDTTPETTAEGAATADPAPTGTAPPADDVAPTAQINPEEIDAFSHGWFEDRSAFSQIALWGSILTVISVLAYQLSKKTRHDSIGFLVGIVPFVIGLYFFYQNINRLLPPGL